MVYSAWPRKAWPFLKRSLDPETLLLFLFSVFFHENKQIPTVQLGKSILELAQEYSRDLFIFMKNTENGKKKFFGQVTFWGKVILFCVKHYIMWGWWVSKDAEFNVDFKNINLR
jgi:hypothetical protein